MAKDKHICEHCGKEFHKYSSQGATKFCSNKCYHDSTIKPRTIAICICGKVLSRTPFHVERDDKKYCSQACYHKSRIGVKISEHQKECLARSHTAKSKNNVKGSYAHDVREGGKSFKNPSVYKSNAPPSYKAPSAKQVAKAKQDASYDKAAFKFPSNPKKGDVATNGYGVKRKWTGSYWE